MVMARGQAKLDASLRAEGVQRPAAAGDAAAVVVGDAAVFLSIEEEEEEEVPLSSGDRAPNTNSPFPPSIEERQCEGEVEELLSRSRRYDVPAASFGAVRAARRCKWKRWTDCEGCNVVRVLGGCPIAGLR